MMDDSFGDNKANPLYSMHFKTPTPCSLINWHLMAENLLLQAKDFAHESLLGVKPLHAW